MFFQDAAVLVSDLSGFTSGTRKHGIMHVASVIVRMRQLCLPVLHKHEALFVGTEGDNLLVVLPTARAAVDAAAAMRSAMLRHNAALPESRKHHQIQLSGIGVHCGGPVLVEKATGALRGEVASLAYYIGEELCLDGNILVSSAVVERLRTSSPGHVHSFVETQLGNDDERHAVTVHELVRKAPPAKTVTSAAASSGNGHRRPAASATKNGSPPPPLPAHDDGRFLHPALLPLAARHACSDAAALAALDADLDALLQPATVLMFRIADASEANGASVSTADADTARRGEKAALQLLRPLLQQHNGVELEPCLWLFRSVADAVWASIGAARAARTTVDADAMCGASVHGFGVHYGPLLYIEGTDVHWGDPVNTASKLGQDLARGGQVLLSSTVHEELLRAEPEAAAQRLTFTPLEVTISKVRLTAFDAREVEPMASGVGAWFASLCSWN